MIPTSEETAKQDPDYRNFRPTKNPTEKASKFQVPDHWNIWKPWNWENIGCPPLTQRNVPLRTGASGAAQVGKSTEVGKKRKSTTGSTKRRGELIIAASRSLDPSPRSTTRRGKTIEKRRASRGRRVDLFLTVCACASFLSCLSYSFCFSSERN